MHGSFEVTIGPLEKTQHVPWLSLWRAYQAFYGIDIPDEVSDITFARMLDPAEPVFGALAWRGARAVGLVHYLTHRSTWSVENSCYLQDLFVAPQARGLGAGRQLIEYVYADADREGWGEVYWLTHETNAKARALYDHLAERTGFLHYARVPKA